MTFSRTSSLLSLASALALVGCPSPSASPDAARVPDAFVALDAPISEPDAFVPGDAGTDAFTPSDAGRDAPLPMPDALVTDAGVDCMYVPIDEVVVKCDGRYRFVNHFQSDRGAACPPFYGFTLEGPHYATSEEAIASDATCETRCIYTFAMSVSRIYCGHRSGYETLTAPGCAEIFRFSEGYFDSVESHDAMHPCPPVP